MAKLEEDILNIIKSKGVINQSSFKFDNLSFDILQKEYDGIDSDDDVGRKLGATYYILYKKDEPNKLYYTWENHLTRTIFEPLEWNPQQEQKYNDKYISLLTKLLKKLSANGGKRIAPAAPAYKLNGEKVSLLINKKKLHRSVYVKGNGKAKYCKINYEFVLLSKLKNKIL
jgi:hypothetical protein